MAFYSFSSNCTSLIAVSYVSPTSFSQPLVHLNYLNIIFYRQLGQSALAMCTNHTVATPVTVLVVDECSMSMESWWNDTNSVEPKYSETNLGSNLGLHGDRPGTNCLSHALVLYIRYIIFTLFVSELYHIFHTGHSHSQNGKCNL